MEVGESGIQGLPLLYTEFKAILGYMNSYSTNKKIKKFIIVLSKLKRDVELLGYCIFQNVHVEARR